MDLSAEGFGLANTALSALAGVLTGWALTRVKASTDRNAKILDRVDTQSDALRIEETKWRGNVLDGMQKFNEALLDRVKSLEVQVTVLLADAGRVPALRAEIEELKIRTDACEKGRRALEEQNTRLQGLLNLLTYPNKEGDDV